jgi:biopolymer transport protein ExbD
MQTSTAGSVAPVPNVTPMIDVMLVLLCIFMVVTPALANGVLAEPPRAENLKPHPEDQTDHTLAIDVHGAYYLDRKAISPEALGAALAVLFPAGSDDRVLYLRAHRALRYEGVDRALEIARSNGVAVVGLVSQSRDPLDP